MTFTQDHLHLLCQIATEAGEKVMDVYATDVSAWLKEDNSPLTEADLRSDAVIRQGLQHAFPGVFILSEESTSDAASSQESFFLVDPLDGTKEFLKRNDEFTVNIALVHCGEPVAGVVFAPALREMFFGAKGLGAWKQSCAGSTQIRVAAREPSQPLRVIGSRSHGTAALEAWLCGLEGEHSFVAAGSSLKFCRIAEQQADVYPRFGPTCQWDTAAGHAVLQAAGGAVLDLKGRPLRYGLELPILNKHFVALGDLSLADRVVPR